MSSSVKLPLGCQPSSSPLQFVGVEHDRLLQSVYRRVFGDASPVQIGRYTVLERIGAGGMGVVFKGYDNHLDRLTAIKVLPILAPEAHERTQLAREAKALAQLSHPNVVGVYEVGQSENGETFLAMEFVKGANFRQWLAQEPRTWRQVLSVGLQAGAGLLCAHAVGLVHRDVKPENILVGDDGRARVADFGLARVQGGYVGGTAAAAALAQTCRVAGTPAYMAPELFDAGPATFASDQFAYCVTLFEALYGVRPFEGEDAAQLVRSVRDGRLSIGPRSSAVPSAVYRAVVRGLAADPTDRYPSIQLLTDALGRAARRRRPWVWGLAGLSLLSVGVAGGVLITPPAVPELHADGPSTVVVVAAAAMVATDPGSAIEKLAQLPVLDGSDLLNQVRGIAEQAETNGIPDTVVSIPFRYSVTTCEGLSLLVDKDNEFSVLCEDFAAAAGVPWADLGHGGWRASTPCNLVSPSASLVLWRDRDPGRSLTALGPGRSQELGESVWAPAFSKNGSWLAYIADGDIRVMNTSTWEARIVDSGSDYSLASLAVNDAGTRVAVAANDAVVLYHLDTGARSERPAPASAKLRFVPNRPWLIIVGRTGGLYRWDWTKDLMVPLGARAKRYYDAAVSPSGEWLVARTEHVVELQALEGPGRREWDADAFSMSADGRRIALREDAGWIRIVDVDSWDERVVRAPATPASFALASDARSIIAHTKGKLTRWPLPPVRPALVADTQFASALAFSSDGKSLFSSGGDYTLRRWDLQTGESVLLDAHCERAHKLLVGSKGRWVATQSNTATLVRDLEGRMLAEATLHRPFEDGRGGLIGIANGESIERWDPITGQREILATGLKSLFEGYGGCGHFAISANGSRLAATCGVPWSRGKTVVWSFPGLEHIDTLAARAAQDLVFWPDQSQVFTSDLKNNQVFWDVGIGTAVRSGGGPLAYSGIGHTAQVLLTRGDERGLSLRVGDRNTTVKLDTAMPWALALSTDSRLIAYATSPTRIAIRERTVPADAHALKSWIADHLPTRVELR